MRATDAATAIGFGGRPDRQRTQLLDFRPILKGKLLGFAKVELPIGLRISDIPILAGKTASLPHCRQDLSLISTRLDASGRPVYRASIEFRNRRIAERFNTAVLDALRREHPHALAGQASS